MPIGEKMELISDELARSWKDFIVLEYLGKVNIYPVLGVTRLEKEFGIEKTMNLEDIDLWFRVKKSSLAYTTDEHLVMIFPAMNIGNDLFVTSMYRRKTIGVTK